MESNLLNEYELITDSNNDPNDPVNKFVDYIDIPSYHMEQVPTNVSISTMSLAYNFGTLINAKNIYKYMILESDNIVAVKSPEGIRCINEQIKKKFKSTNKNSKKNFFNQNTIIMNITGERFTNIKLFKNGSIQMTGCKYLSDANIAINKLFNKLKEKLIVKTDNTEKEITFVDEPEKLSVNKFKIDLINTNFGVSYLINKEKLFNILTNKGVLCRLSAIHSCVNIKYKIINEQDKYVSIFVFQTGNIIITGAKKAEHIKETYNYIVQFLNQNKQNIMKKDISKILDANDFKEILGSS